MISIGIDYSINSPSMCVCDGEFSYENCQFYVYSNCPKKYQNVFDGRITITGQPTEYGNNVERFCGISEFYRDIIKTLPGVDVIGLEDYAFAAAGRVFHIAENTFALKEMLWKDFHLSPSLIAPSAAKRFATGKGNAKKEQMYDAFLEKTKKDLAKTIGWDKTKVDSPLSDIIDSFFICGTAINEKKNTENR